MCVNVQVGGIKPGCFKIGNTGGMLDNILASKLYRPGSVAYVSRSGGMSNELNNIISRTTDGVFEGVAIGGDRFVRLLSAVCKQCGCEFWCVILHSSADIQALCLLTMCCATKTLLEWRWSLSWERWWINLHTLVPAAFGFDDIDCFAYCDAFLRSICFLNLHIAPFFYINK